MREPSAPLGGVDDEDFFWLCHRDGLCPPLDRKLIEVMLNHGGRSGRGCQTGPDPCDQFLLGGDVISHASLITTREKKGVAP